MAVSSSGSSGGPQAASTASEAVEGITVKGSGAAGGSGLTKEAAQGGLVKVLDAWGG